MKEKIFKTMKKIYKKDKNQTAMNKKAKFRK